jgi:hypothetical protein
MRPGRTSTSSGHAGPGSGTAGARRGRGGGAATAGGEAGGWSKITQYRTTGLSPCRSRPARAVLPEGVLRISVGRQAAVLHIAVPGPVHRGCRLSADSAASLPPSWRDAGRSECGSPAARSSGRRGSGPPPECIAACGPGAGLHPGRRSLVVVCLPPDVARFARARVPRARRLPRRRPDADQAGDRGTGGQRGHGPDPPRGERPAPTPQRDGRGGLRGAAAAACAVGAAPGAPGRGPAARPRRPAALGQPVRRPAERGSDPRHGGAGADPGLTRERAAGGPFSASIPLQPLRGSDHAAARRGELGWSRSGRRMARASRATQQRRRPRFRRIKHAKDL